MTKPCYRLIILLVAISILFTGCDVGFGSKHTNDPEKYGMWESYLEIPPFLPTSLDSYEVNSYSYTLLAYMDICYEIFLDISVSEQELERLVAHAKEQPNYLFERPAYYSEGYTEIVFEDSYETYQQENEDERNVGWADIEKVIYSTEALNVVYVCFHANDTGVYRLKDLAYFSRFSINEWEYAAKCTI